MLIEYDDGKTPLMVAQILRDNPEQAIGRTLVAAGSRPKESTNGAFVRFVRCARRLLDPTNCVGSSKPLEDWLVKGGVIEDDGPEDYSVDTSQIQVGTAQEEGTSLTITISYR